jgi:hypothetical protein
MNSLDCGSTNRSPNVARTRPASFLFAAVLLLVMSGCRSAPEDGPVEVTVETVSVEAPAVTESFVPTLAGPLRALSLTPRGTLLQMPGRLVFTVTFSQPMVPLGEAPDVSPGFFEIEPPVSATRSSNRVPRHSGWLDTARRDQRRPAC